VSARRLDPEFDPRLVEAAVLAAIRGHGSAGQFHAERDTLYEVVDLEPREAAFEALHARWFRRLGLDQPLQAALAEQPGIAARCGRWLVLPARSRRDEMADLLVGSDVRPTLLLQVTPEMVATPERLWPLLRRELRHVADMLDPAFGYEATLPPGGGGSARERVVRDSYRVLWNAWVDGRLVRLGRLPATARAERLADFARAFPHLGTGAEAAFDRFFDAPQLTHAALVAFAAGGPEGARPTRCRICDLPTCALEPAPETLPGEVLAAIGRDFPWWRPADGLCRRCAELYMARAPAHTR
jgi:hypothetical protein